MPYIKPEPGNEVVISGIAGRYPSCQNIQELKEKILNKEDLITDTTRWSHEYSEIPSRAGQVPDPEKFDSTFFGIQKKQTNTVDPMGRFLMELCYEAIVDAGCNPVQLRGKKVAVIIGLCYSESERMMMFDRGNEGGGYVVTGCSRAMMANRISFWLGVHGPSYAMDTACSASGFALEQAYRLIMSGECEGALVGGANLCLHPYLTLQFARLGVLSPDGRCKVFDADADGYVRSDAICAVYLQRAKDAKRVYATVVHCKTNIDGYKKEGIVFPSWKLQSELITEFYDECKIPLSALNYLEAHGTGTKVGDPEEVFAIDAAICKKRTKPLWIGSVKSNMGHTEPASCLCSISKVIIAMETGMIPPNINFKQPKESLKAIIDGRLRVVTEKTPWELGYAAVNTFGFGGANAHVLLKSNTKEKLNNGLPNDDLSRVVVVSGRTQDAVNTLLDSVENLPVDAEYIRLLHDVHAYNTPKHLYRGYSIIGSKYTKTKVREVIPYNETSRPVWFVFSGMGSQWPEMGKMLMRFPVFAKAIEKCDAVLRPRGVDIVHVITSNNKPIFNNILNCFVGTAAIQIGMVDLLTAAGIVADNIIGHSVGELGCAYADGCFSAEEMILAAHARGLASIETDMIDGAMAAIGLGAQMLEKMCPPDIDVACHNSNTSCTISGPLASIKDFVAKLTEKKIFAREVASGNIAYHSRYIAKVGPKLLTYLKEIIPKPKVRSEKWLSSSVPENDWSNEAAKYSSAEYHTNNLLSAVLFEETAKHIPQNAICIEIAPHGLLQAIVKRSLAPETANVPLSLRGHKDNAEFFAQALGKLYNLGLQPKIANIYPPVSFPVSRGTPMISPHIKWDHTTDWYIAYFDDKDKIASGERTLDISTSDQSLQYMAGHVIDGRNLIPATGYISIVWETLAQMKRCPQMSLSVIFENVQFHRAATIPNDTTAIKLTVMINKGTGEFGILDDDTALVTGKVRGTSNPASEMANATFLPHPPGDESLDTQDIYQELRIRGYEYRGLFQSLKSATFDGTKGHIAWHDNYVTFIDNMLQLNILGIKKRSLFVPTSIRKLIIDPKMHEEMVISMKDDKTEFPVYVYKNLDLIASGGVQVFGLLAKSIPRRKLGGTPVLEVYKFVAYRDRAQVSIEEIAILSCQFALEAQPAASVKTLEVVDDQDDIPAEDLLSPILLSVLKNLPLVQPIAYLAASNQKYKDNSPSSEIRFIDLEKLPADQSIFIVVGSNLLAKEKEQKLAQVLSSLRSDGFILTQEDAMTSATINQTSNASLNIVLEKCNGSKTLLLLRKHLIHPVESVVVSVGSKELTWVEKLKEIMKRHAGKEASTRIILVTQADRESGILGMVNCLRKEPGGDIVRAVIIDDENTPSFALDNQLYTQQLQLDLPINIFKDGAWGSYRHLSLPPQKPKLTYHAYVEQVVRGDLKSLRWVEGPFKPTDRPEDQIHTVYTALNFKDVMVASGKLSEEMVAQRKNRTCTHSLIGFEYSGITARGERLMAFSTVPGIANKHDPELSITWKIPEEWSLEDAATVPAVYATVCYAFYVLDNIKSGEKILIHSGSGGIGQAAIHLALQEGLEVFTTVGTPDKRSFIRERFPSIPDDHIGNSRDTSFEYMIKQGTDGRGVDVVLNSLAGDKLLASVRCLASHGRFLEIGKYDIAENNALHMLVFMKEISFRSIMLDYTMAETGGNKLKILKNVVQDFIDRGRIQPLTRKVFDKEKVESAIRYMATGNHIGKVLLKMDDEKRVQNKPILAYPRFYCSKLGSCVIFGGLGGLGLEVAEWLSSRGVRNLVLVTRRGITTGYQKYKIHQWQADGINVEIIKGREGWKRDDCEYILKAAAKLGPVDAIFNLAVQLKDSIFANQTIETFEESLRPKVGITKQLDQLSRILCPELRYFVVFSSVSCGRGNPGQTNYGYGNAVMERICERRVAEGLPALAIQWGAVGEVGIVANMQNDNKKINMAGTLLQTVSSCMQEMEKFLLQNHPVVSSMVVAEKRNTVGSADNPLQAVLNIIGVKNIESVNMDTPLIELGMDSMLTVEVKETLEREFDVFFTATEMRALNVRNLMALSSDDKSVSVKSRGVKTSTEFIDENDEVLWGTTQIIPLLTGLMECTQISVEYPVPTDKSGTRVFLFPGATGSPSIFSPLLSNLAYSAVCLQFPLTDHNETISSLAEYLLPYIVEKLASVTQIVLVGYSFGTCVVIEVAKRLESLGHKLCIILIDGLPSVVKRLVFPEVKSNSVSDIHNRVLSAVAKNIVPAESSQLLQLWEKLESLNEKLDILVSSAKLLDVPVEFQKGFIKGLCSRGYALCGYEDNESPQLTSPITLLKATMGLTRLPDGCYNLEKITNGPVKELCITGNHNTVLLNKEIATVINNSFVNNNMSQIS